jgi:hypothetical protein
MPPKNKDFTPQQKAAITKQYNKIKDLTKSVAKEKAGFLKLSPKELKNLPENFDYVAKTNLGIFTKFATPKKVKNKKGELIVETKIGVRVERFFPFDKTLNTMQKIGDYVKILQKKYKPDYIRWSVNGYRGGEFFSPETFNNYVQEYGDAIITKKQEKKFSENRFFNGVFLGWLNRGKS